MTTIPKPYSLANGLTAKYDGWNRLVEVMDGQTVIGKYEYDGLNRRIKRGLDTQSPSSPDGVDKYIHYFYNAAWQTLETRETATETDQPETLQPNHQHAWSLRYVDAPVLRDENTDTDGLCDDARIYFLNDANFNVTTLVDTNGDAVERYVYSPYGAALVYDGTWANTRTTSSYDNVVLFTGREYDCETGLYYYRNRYYSPQLGSFVSRDPIDFEAGDLNLFRYVGNAPLVRTDPTGEHWYCLWLDNLFHCGAHDDEEKRNDTVDGICTTIGTQAPPGSEVASGAACIAEMCQPDNMENYAYRQMMVYANDPVLGPYWERVYNNIRNARQHPIQR
jgi:RHS repeat-associated protein